MNVLTLNLNTFDFIGPPPITTLLAFSAIKRPDKGPEMQKS